MAIRVLLDHGVPEDHIIFIAFLVARAGGISVLRRAFPKVKIVCGAVDEEMVETWLEGSTEDENPESDGRQIWLMNPGMGHIGVFSFWKICTNIIGLILATRRSLLSMTRGRFHFWIDKFDMYTT